MEAKESKRCMAKKEKKTSDKFLTTKTKKVFVII